MDEEGYVVDPKPPPGLKVTFMEADAGSIKPDKKSCSMYLASGGRDKEPLRYIGTLSAGDANDGKGETLMLVGSSKASQCCLAEADV